MENQTKLSRKEKIELRKKLKLEGKNICFSEWCNGTIKTKEKFVKNRNICLDCNKKHHFKFYENNMRSYKRTKFKLKIGKVCNKCGCPDIYDV